MIFVLLLAFYALIMSYQTLSSQENNKHRVTTPAFLSLIPNGLNNSEHPEWGGRYELYEPDFSKTE